jgi:hypothetical protein
MYHRIAISFYFIFLSINIYAVEIPDFLRQGVDATPEQIAIAVDMYNQGWRYTMPTPRSAQAAWGNTDRRTLWNNGGWRNEKTGAYSYGTPRKDNAGLYNGDRENTIGSERRGSPGQPDVYMFLLSRSGGPRATVAVPQNFGYQQMGQEDHWTTENGSSQSIEGTTQTAEPAQPLRLIPLSQNIQISQYNRRIQEINGQYEFPNGPFTIRINSGVLKKPQMYIYATTNQDIFSRYNYPVDRENSVFAPGSGAARNEHDLLVGDSVGFNLVNNGENIRNLRFENSPMASIYLLLYAEQNNNQTIENEEIAHVKISVTGELSGGIYPVARNVLPERTPPPQPMRQRYRIGQQGPAGGIVFYDKGEYSDGWRYLEAAPGDFTTTFTWAFYDFSISGLERDIGKGKSNTEKIIAQLEQFNYPQTAAVVCWTIEVNGFRDWFLPSIDELNLLYQNLYRSGRGGFNANNVYWSSTSPGWLSNNMVVTKTVRGILFENGGTANIPQTNKESVRAIRSF